jgi:AcrR family transcriptional regulator
VAAAAPVATPRTRDAVLQHAARLFAERGFRGTSVEDIGSACGVSGPAVYKHFSSKDAILARLLVDISEQLLSGGEQVVREEPDPASALTGLVRFHADFALAEPDVIRVQDRDLASLNERDRTRVRRLQRDYVELWTRVLAQCEPALPDGDARLRVQAVFGLLNSTPHSARGRTGARRQLVPMALRALRS